MSPREFKKFLKQGAEHAGPGSRLAEMYATFGKKVKKADVAKKMPKAPKKASQGHLTGSQRDAIDYAKNWRNK